MNSKKTFVAINFDLDTKKLKNIYVQQTGKKYNQAYYDIKSFMKKTVFHIDKVRDIYQKIRLQKHLQHL